MPVVIKLDRLGYILPLGAVEDMVRLEVFDADPDTDPTAKSTNLAALFADHHEQITSQEDEPPLGRPAYFVRTRGSGNLMLYPRCDQTHWFRATFRPPIRKSDG